MIAFLNWLCSFLTFGAFSLATISMTYVDEWNYETVTDSGVTLVDLFGETSAFDGTGYNLIENGDFSDTSIWTVSGSLPLTIVSGMGYVNPNNHNFPFIQQTISISSGNKYYVRYYYETEYADDIDSRFSGGTVTDIYNDTTKDIESLTVTSVVTALDNNNYFQVYFYDGSYMYQNGEGFYIDNVIVFDLTSIYTSGSEPSANEIDTWYSTYQTALTTDEHAYTYSLNTVELEDIVVLVASSILWVVAIKFLGGII